MNMFIRQKAETAKHRNAKHRQTEEQIYVHKRTNKQSSQNSLGTYIIFT